MTADSVLERAVATFEQTMLKNSTRRTSVHSTGFWKQVGVKRRTPLAISRVRDGFAERGIILGTNDGAALGSESSKDRITLRFDDPYRPFRVPSAEWFSQIKGRTFHTEHEVEFNFVMPLLLQFGYAENQIALGKKVLMTKGKTSVARYADAIVYSAADRKHALLVIEAKAPSVKLTKREVDQAASYAMWVYAPYYLVTNGDDIAVYRYSGPGVKDRCLVAIRRTELDKRWADLYRHVNPGRVLQTKERLIEQINGSATDDCHF
jgi:hypothetical protein